MKKFNEFLFENPSIYQDTKNKGKPFVKWVGGKNNIVNVLIKNLPKKYNKYYEPFLGGGALFFKLNPKKAFLSDINSDLIITYNVIKENVNELIEKLKTFKKNHNKEHYLKVRGLLDLTDPVNIAARFIYLNKTCYNGLYRVNKKGHFNVPMGSYKNPLILDKATLLKDNLLLRDALVEQKDFKEITPLKRDFIYFDPPYDETYNGYNDKIFDEEKQVELAKFCKRLDKRGCYFIVSNSDNEKIRKLYEHFNFVELENIRTVNCKGNARGKKKELLIKNYE